MIKIVAQNKVKEGMKEEFIKAVEILIAESKKEKGCIAYDLYEEVSDPQVLTFLETWEDMEAIKAHSQSEHYTTIVPTLEAYVVNKDVKLYKLI